jgi:hypothetical protein
LTVARLGVKDLSVVEADETEGEKWDLSGGKGSLGMATGGEPSSLLPSLFPEAHQFALQCWRPSS